MTFKCLSLAALVLMETSFAVGAQTLKNWNVADGAWTDGGNWDPAGMPLADEAAIIANGGTARISGVAVTTGRFTITGAGSACNGVTTLPGAPLAVGSGAGSVGRLEILDGADVDLSGGLGVYVGLSEGRGVLTVAGVGSTLAIHDLDGGAYALDLGAAPTPGGTVFRVSDGAVVTVRGYLRQGADGGDGAVYLSGTPGSRGVLQVDGVRHDGDSVFHFDGGILRASSATDDLMSGFDPGEIIVESGGGFIDTNGNDVGLSQVLQGSGTLTKIGEGTLTTGESLTWSNKGGVAVDAGMLKVIGKVEPTAGASGVAGASGEAGNVGVTVTGSAALTLEYGIAGDAYGRIVGGAGGDGNFVSGTPGGNGGDAGAGVVYSSSANWASFGEITGGKGGNAGNGSGLPTDVPGYGGVGGAAVLLQSTATFTNSFGVYGGERGQGGYVGLGDDDYLYAADGVAGAGIVISGGGTVINNSGSTIVGGINIVLIGGDAFALRSPGVEVTTMAGHLVNAGTICGGTILHGELVKAGAGTWSIDTALADVTRVTVNAGTLKAASPRSFGANDKAFTVTGGKLDYAGLDLRIGENGTGSIEVESALVNSDNAYIGYGVGSHGTATVGGAWITPASDSVFTVGNAGHGELTLEHGGTITAGQGRVGQSAGGVGEANVSGVWNNATNFIVGTLKLGPAGSLAGTSGIDIAAGATFDVTAAGFTLGAAQTLRGNGAIAGSLAAAGVVSPGNSVGSLTFTGDLTLLSGAETFVEIASAVAFDTFVVSGQLAYGGTLRVGFLGGYLPADGTSYDLVNFGSRGGASTFGNLVIDTPGYAGVFDYGSGTLQIVAVPEPSTWSLGVLGLLAAVVGFRRLRRGLLAGLAFLPISASSFAATVNLTAIADGRTYSDFPNQNAGAETRAYAYRDNANYQISLVRFDLTALPANATIQNATLNLTTTGETFVEKTYAVYRVAGSWVESEFTFTSRSTGVDWPANTFNGTTGKQPDLRGTDGAFGSTPFATGTFALTAMEEVRSFNVTALVKKWAAREFANDGFGLATSETSAKFDFWTRENGTAAKSPTLTITYT